MPNGARLGASCGGSGPTPARMRARGQSRSADRARQLVSAPRARLGPHARGRLRGVRGRCSRLRGARRGDPRSAAPGSALPPAAGFRAARAGTPGVGRRSPLQGHLPRSPHRAATPGERRRATRLAGRVFSQALDRDRPLWELWLVEGLAENRFALLSKTHHALVDGVSGVDIATVLFDASADADAGGPPEHEWVPPPAAELLRSCWPTRCSSGPPCRARSSAACGMRCADRASSPSAWAARSRGSAR